MQTLRKTAPFILLMAIVVASSNYLVQFPVQARVGPLDLADILTWGAFTYPVAFLVTDLTNRRFGVGPARLVVACGFVFAVAVSMGLSTPRIAIASGTAYLVGQLLDVTVFNRLRRLKWWKAPLTASLVGSVLDTVIFFSVAFAPAFSFVGPNDPFAIAGAPLFGVLSGKPAALRFMGRRRSVGQAACRADPARALRHAARRAEASAEHPGRRGKLIGAVAAGAR